jgi:hypothetical protein
MSKKDEMLKHFRNNLKEIHLFYENVSTEKNPFSQKNYLIFESLFLEMQNNFMELEALGMSEDELRIEMEKSAKSLGTGDYQNISLQFIDMTKASSRFRNPTIEKPN